MLEAALHTLRQSTAIDPDIRRVVEDALNDAHGRLIQQWFGGSDGQDTLFDDPRLAP